MMWCFIVFNQVLQIYSWTFCLSLTYYISQILSLQNMVNVAKMLATIFV